MSDVAPIVIPAARRIRLGDKVLGYQYIIRRSAHLSAHEFRLVIVLFDASVGWGRLTYLCEQGELARRCGMSRRTVQNAQQALVGYGLLQIQPTGKFNRYRVLLEDGMSKLSVSRKSRQMRRRCASDAQEVRRPFSSISEDDSANGNQSENSNQTADPEVRDRPAPVQAADEIERIQTGWASRQVVRLASLKLPDLQNTWMRTARTAYEIREVHAWSPKERGQARHIVRRWTGTPEQLHDFLTFCSTTWEQILRGKFDWMREAPANPDIGFILGFYEKFMDAWTRRELDQAARDRSRVEQLALMGYTVEQADAIAAAEEQLEGRSRKLRERERRVAGQIKEVRQARGEIRKTTSPQHRGGGSAQRPGTLPSMSEIPNYYEDER